MQFTADGRNPWGKPAPGDKVLNCFWRLLEWYSDSGVLMKRKGRVCTMGNKLSKEDDDFKFSFSATVSYDQVRMLAALAATSDKDLFTADVKGAYLTCERTLEPGQPRLWLRPPPHFENQDDRSLCILVKTCLYGLRDSGRRWWFKYRQAMEAIGFRSVDCDPCLYQRDRLSEQNGQRPDIKSKSFVAAALWVDDSLVLTSADEFKRVVGELREKGIDIDKHGEAKKFVGIDFLIRHVRLNKQDAYKVE
jgi:hypothetical protein